MKRLHIVIAEDDMDDADMICESFRRHESYAKVDLVRNGLELMDYLKVADPLPDVILTDINMPILDGVEALEQICANDKLHKIPAFVYSTAINPIYQARCNNLGTKGFLVKPIRLEDFDNISQIREILSAAS